MPDLHICPHTILISALAGPFGGGRLFAHLLRYITRFQFTVASAVSSATGRKNSIEVKQETGMCIYRGPLTCLHCPSTLHR